MANAYSSPNSGDYEGQAEFYCEENNYDIRKAKQAFD